MNLSQLALKDAGDNDSLISSTEKLLGVLQRTCEHEAFDEKLADCKLSEHVILSSTITHKY